ncbi:MAG: amidohydrolase [Sphingomonadales bacterium]|nr:amidohydrolase [Sphingomonadales bacterium]
MKKARFAARRAVPLSIVWALAIGLATPAPAATLIDNVDGFTLDKDGAIERLNGLLIGDDGRIVQVLHRGDKRPGKVTYLLDGKGRVLMPGLIDAHVHVMDLGFGALTLDLSMAKSLAEAQARIAAYAAAHPDRPWIIGRGWNEERWGLGRVPTTAELDAAVANRPAWLVRADGQAGWANSAALRAARVTAGTPPDAAMAAVRKAVPAPRPEDRDLALALAQDQLLRRGVTAVADMGTTIEDWQAFRRAGDLGSLRVRIMAYAAGTEAMSLIGGPGPTPWLYDDRLRLNGVQISVDGSLGSRGGLLKTPYADAPGRSGRALLDDTQLRNLMSRAAIDRFQVAVDASGDKAAAMVLNAIGELSDTYKGDRRWRIERAQVVDTADLARFGQHGIVVSLQPEQQSADRLVAEARLGPARLAGAFAWASLAKTGARLAFGSGAPEHGPDPFAGIAVAATRQDAEGQPFGGWQPQERVTREAALAAYTTGAAYAGFAEGRFGRLATGLRADFVLIDRDPLMTGPGDLRATNVLETWVGGRKVWAAGK